MSKTAWSRRVRRRSPDLTPLPFEIIFETPQTFPAVQQASAATSALLASLREYHQFVAYGQNL